MNKLASYIIIRIIFILVIFSVYSLSSGAMEDRTSLARLAGLFDRCKPLERENKTNKAVLRIDDIQAFAWSDVQVRLIEDALKYNITPVVGVIPYNLEEDRIVYDLIKKNRCNLEIAQHGWTHGGEPNGAIPEFGAIGQTEAYERIMKGKPILEKLYGRELSAFIPPNNIYSPEAAKAIRQAGFKVISAQGRGGYHYNASTYDSDSDGLAPVEDIVAACQEAFAKNNLCVIMAHPQDYAADGRLDSEKYAHYLELLGRLNGLDAEFVKFEDLISIGGSGDMPELSDYDNDGLNYREEKIYGTDPVDPDSDNDGYLDGTEVFNGFDPLRQGESRI